MIELDTGNAIAPCTWAMDYALGRMRRIQDYHEHPDTTKQRQSIAWQFRNRGFHPAITSHRIVLTAGTTPAYGAVLDLIRHEYMGYMIKTGERRRPAIVMPVPNYGNFITMAEIRGFEVIPLERDPQREWTLGSGHLHSALSILENDKDVNVVVFYDCNPCNPTGHVRGRRETVSTGTMIYSQNMMQQVIHGEEKHFPIRIIDDMVYDGTEYGPEQPFSFMQMPKPQAETFVLFGGSKTGMAAIRTGGVICSSARSARILEEFSRINSGGLSAIATHAAEALFGSGPDLWQPRQQHLGHLRQEHMFGERFLRTLINGRDPSEDLSDADWRRMVDGVAAGYGVNADRAKDILAQGIHGVRIVTRPKAGFFHLADMNPCLENTAFLREDTDLRNFLMKGGLRIATGSRMGLRPGQGIMRLSYAHPDGYLVAATRRLKELLGQICP
ncbi:MAG: pyridoxal phosphate-dependent aminotransferase [Pseudomonadota bacterium]|nr:pyridoxal phosphate-dependent aminotransferase [Pseudomonadota bacterium]